MTRKSKSYKKFLIMILLAGLAYYFYWGNNTIQVSYYNYADPAIPESFNEYRIAHVSDLHNKKFGNELIDEIEKQQPDIILITGDLIDSNRTDLTVAETFLKKVKPLAPVYFVSGNHEVASGKYKELKEIINETGVINLDDRNQLITKDDQSINLIGLADPLSILLEDIEEAGSKENVVFNKIDELVKQPSDHFNLLLSHRPELIDIYQKTGVDLVLAGHAHGGQIRLPFIGGLYAPSQGLLPEYVSGTYMKEDTTLIVSRGLGNSLFPLRIFNRPELVIVTLETKLTE
ncbi:metallophosphoesterase [Alkalibacterium kapii]|uniref:Phosphoesterase n=1 Tax=Alkalibacterium kapii TaxID=426704 RepID=A0A511AV62_9LACT|nr:metallophosphoesterase [Alkalibacterium kapii]GEK92089.1 phosphoesterase [Alkalibacterium kapii]